MVHPQVPIAVSDENTEDSEDNFVSKMKSVKDIFSSQDEQNTKFECDGLECASNSSGENSPVTDAVARGKVQKCMLPLVPPPQGSTTRVGALTI